MPRQVDHQARRETLAEAVWRVVRRGGVQALTVRAVASEMQASTSAVTHYFANREHLLLHAFELVAERVRQRMSRHIGEGDPLTVLGCVLREALPLDEERRVEAAIWFAFLGLATGTPRLQDVARHRYRNWHQHLVELLGAAQQAGRLDLDDLDGVATEVIAVIEGIALRAHLDAEHVPSQTQEALLEAWLERLTRSGDTNAPTP